MSNIDEKAKNNFTIEMRIFEKYEKVKYEIIKVIDFLEHSGTAMGMCRKKFLCVFKAFLGNALNTRRLW